MVICYVGVQDNKISVQVFISIGVILLRFSINYSLECGKGQLTRQNGFSSILFLVHAIRMESYNCRV